MPDLGVHDAAISVFTMPPIRALQIRHFAVGLKNWLFCGSEAAASDGSTWLTLVLSVKMHGLQVEACFRELFRLLPQWPKSRLLELAPHKVGFRRGWVAEVRGTGQNPRGRPPPDGRRT